MDITGRPPTIRNFHTVGLVSSSIHNWWTRISETVATEENPFALSVNKRLYENIYIRYEETAATINLLQCKLLDVGKRLPDGD